MKVVISGYYGFDNAGDEAVLAAILAGLRRECPTVHPVVLSGNPARTAARHGVEAVPRLSLAAVRRALREADLFVSGGGTLLQDLTGWGSVPYYGGLMLLAHRLGVPVFAWAQGIGPLRRPALRRMAGRALAAAVEVTVRDQASAALARELGVDPRRIHLVADPVFALAGQVPAAAALGSEEPPAGDGLAEAAARLLSALPDGPLVGVSLRLLPGERPATVEQRFFADAATRDLAACLARWGARALPLPLHPPQDGPPLDRLVAVLGPLAVPWPAGVEPADLSPADWLALFRRLDLVLTMRLHGLIFAACAGVPFVAVGSDPKLAAHVAELGLPRAPFLIERPGLGEALEAVWAERQRWRAAIVAGALRLRERAQATARRALAVTRGAAA